MIRCIPLPHSLCYLFPHSLLHWSEISLLVIEILHPSSPSSTTGRARILFWLKQIYILPENYTTVLVPGRFNFSPPFFFFIFSE
ncbi:hypothetical protein RIF29_45478 [Crotalaria pallida]|uniref:Uncharacterized protein n=1 Tax=Crotalaria pallida TaxID=3830 RepID=A0AAN9DUN6_CROPI